MSREEVIEIFKKHFEDNELFRSLGTYLDQKDAYLANRTTENMIDLKYAYEYIYTDMKYWLSAGKISSATFWHLVDILQEDL